MEPNWCAARRSRIPVAVRDAIATNIDRDSTPHHSATNSAIAVVIRFTEARLTRSSKPWMFCEIGP
jgi:hypothetical protein